MKCSIFVALALAMAAAAAPAQQGKGGFGQKFGQGNNGAAAKGAAQGAAAAKGANNAGKGAAAAGAAAGAAGAAAGAAAANSTATGNSAATATSNNGDIQSSLTLDPSVIATGFADDGQDVPAAGQVASLTSTNNFINFCAGQTITNGKQITAGSCNPAPMGQIPATTAMPSAKFVNPANGDTIAANTAFTITMAIANMETGNFVNAEENYFAAPQQLNSAGQIIGHSHVVVETLSALDQTTPTDPTKFAFFKGLNAAAVNGQLTADVTAGLPAGVYKLSSINTAANHQPVLVPIAQHGSLDDAVYFTVSDSGAAAASNATAAAAAAATSAAATAGKGAAAKGAKNGKGKRFELSRSSF